MHKTSDQDQYPVDSWMAENFSFPLNRHDETPTSIAATCVSLGRMAKKLEYRITGRRGGLFQDESDFTVRFNPWTGARVVRDHFANGSTELIEDYPTISTDGWFVPGSRLMTSPLWKNPALLAGWRNFYIEQLVSVPGHDLPRMSVSMYNARYFRITQDSYDDDPGWDFVADGLVDCGLYFCQFDHEGQIYYETEARSVDVLVSGYPQLHRYERGPDGELSLVNNPESA